MKKMHCNNNTKPVIFLGSSDAQLKYADVCTRAGIKVHGIIDNDYYGNTESLDGIPVIDSELNLQNKDILEYYTNNFNFFCTTTWMPTSDQHAIRNREKRHNLISCIEQNRLPCISLVDHSARLSSSTILGSNVFIDAFVCCEPHTFIDSFTSIFAGSIVGHHTKIKENCVLQRGATIAGNCTIEANCYFATHVKALKDRAVFGANTFVQEAIYIRRGTVPNEVVKQNGKNMKRVFVT